MLNEERIFASWAADMYDEQETDLTDAEFACSVIGAPSKRILEIACGNGRMLVPLAKAGHVVTGLDFDEFMLSKIPDKAKGLRQISWRKADAMSEDWGSGYDVVMLAANFLFNIVTDLDYAEAQSLAIRKAAKALAPGGHLYIDYSYTLHPEDWFENPGEKLIWEGRDTQGNTGRMVLLDNTFDREKSLAHFVRRYELTLPDGRVIRRDIPNVKHFASLEEIHGWLAASGLVIEEEYGDYARSPIGETTNRAIIWARKQ